MQPLAPLELKPFPAGTCSWELLQFLTLTLCPRVLSQGLAPSACPGDGAGSCQPTGHAVLVPWDTFPRAPWMLHLPQTFPGCQA